MSSNRRYTPFVTVVATLAALGCGDPPTAIQNTGFDPAGTHQSPLVELSGLGTGGVGVTPQSVADGSFSAVIKVRIHGAKPSTLYTVQRSPEIGRALGSDGICQRAMGLSPWSSTDAPAAAFVTFSQPGTTTPITLMTTATGDGTLDFAFAAATIPSGTLFDVMFRVIDDLTVPRSVYLSGCFTVKVL
jgi:hypothetical protein